MPRQRRIHVSGGMYHAVLRGNHRQALFSHCDDHLRFGEMKTCGRSGVTHALVQARMAIARRALIAGVANLSQVARQLNRAPTTLSDLLHGRR